MADNTPLVLKQWHAVLANRDMALLQNILADNVVFHSPVVHTPQQGKQLCMAYLGAAAHVLGTPDFKYLREVISERVAVLEFVTELDGIVINGVDIIEWDDNNQITDSKVMVRPLKAIGVVHQKMADMLSAMKG